MSTNGIKAPLNASKSVTRSFESMFFLLPDLSAQERNQLSDMIRNVSEEQLQVYLQEREEVMARSRASTNFPKFRKLPPELRLKIWSFSAPDPRVIRQMIKTKKIGYRSTTVLEYWQSTPAVLSVCKESREAYLQTSEYDIGNNSIKSRPTYRPTNFSLLDPSHMRLMFSPEIDCLYMDIFCNNSLMSMDISDEKSRLAVDGLKQVRRLAVWSSSSSGLFVDKRSLLAKVFIELKFLTFIECSTYDDVELPEVNGEMVFEGRNPENVARYVHTKRKLIQQMALYQQQNPTWRTPIMKYRSYVQFNKDPFGEVNRNSSEPH